MSTKLVYGILSLVILISIVPSIGNAQTSRDLFNQCIADLQKNPNDSALRIKIILLAQSIKPAPVITDEAREKYVMGITLREDKEYELAATNINKALLIAPWWGDAYKELGLTLEAAKKYDQAIIAYQLYIKTMQDDEAISHVKDEIAIMKAKKMKVEKEQAEANSPQAQEAALLQKVEGAKVTQHYDLLMGKWDEIYQIKNQTLIISVRIYSLKPGKEVSGFYETGEHIVTQIPYRDGKFTNVGPYETEIYTLQLDGKALVVLAYLHSEPKEKGNTNVYPWD